MNKFECVRCGDLQRAFSLWWHNYSPRSPLKNNAFYLCALCFYTGRHYPDKYPSLYFLCLFTPSNTATLERPPSGVFSRKTASDEEIRTQCDNAVPKSLQLAMDANSSKLIEVSQLLVTHRESDLVSSFHNLLNHFFKNPKKQLISADWLATDVCCSAGSNGVSVFHWVKIIWIFFKGLCCISFETRCGGGEAPRSDSFPLMPSRDPAVITCNLLLVLATRLLG